MQTANVMIVDDHPLVRSGFRQLLETEPRLNVCCEAATISEAVQLFNSNFPDLVIVDLSLPDGNGLDLIKRMLAKKPDTLILVSSMYDVDLFAKRALHAGAKGYINKQEAGEQVLVAVRQILRGKLYISEQLKQHTAEEPVNNSANPALSFISSLSNRELEVFELIGHGTTTRKIADKLHLSVKTIESHRANIKSKLGLLSGGELIRSAVQWTLDT